MKQATKIKVLLSISAIFLLAGVFSCINVTVGDNYKYGIPGYSWVLMGIGFILLLIYILPRMFKK